MQAIFKYVFPTWAIDLQIPGNNAQPLCIGMQEGQLVLWVLVEPDGPLNTRRFAIIQTGEPIPAGAKYVGTYDQHFFVGHVFELVKPNDL